MLPDIIEGLSGLSRRNLARNLFAGFYERGISAGAALNELQGQGLGYRRQDFLADFRQGQGVYDNSIRVRFVGENRTPSENILEGKYFGVPDRYSFVYKATGLNQSTSEIEEKYFFYHRNNLDTKGNMENDAFDWFSEQSDKYGIDITSIKTVEGYINPVWK